MNDNQVWQLSISSIYRLDPLAVREGVPYSALEISASSAATTEAFNKLAKHTEQSHKKAICQLLVWAWHEKQPSAEFKDLLGTIPAEEVGSVKKVIIQFVTFAGFKPVHQEAQSFAIFGFSWKDSICNSFAPAWVNVFIPGLSQTSSKK